MFRLCLICLSKDFHPFNQFKQEIKPEPDSPSGVKKKEEKDMCIKRSHELWFIRFTSVNPPPQKWFNLQQSVFCGVLCYIMCSTLMFWPNSIGSDLKSPFLWHMWSPVMPQPPHPHPPTHQSPTSSNWDHPISSPCQPNWEAFPPKP